MRLRKGFATWLVLAAVLGGSLWLLLRDDDERRILDRLDAVRTLAEVTEPESALAQITRARQLGTLFTPASRYDLTTLGHGVTAIDSREELVRRIAAARATLTSLELDLLAPSVMIDGDRAVVTVTGTAAGATRKGDGRFMDVHTVEITLQRQDGVWLLSGGRHIRDERAVFRGGE